MGAATGFVTSLATRVDAPKRGVKSLCPRLGFLAPQAGYYLLAIAMAGRGDSGCRRARAPWCVLARVLN